MDSAVFAAEAPPSISTSAANTGLRTLTRPCFSLGSISIPTVGRKFSPSSGGLWRTPTQNSNIKKVTAQETLDRMSLLTADTLAKYSKPYTKIIKEIYNPAFRGGK